MMNRSSGIAALAALLSCGIAQADPKPLWEFGMGVGGIAFPDYRGSDEMQVYPVPLPYGVYRGKFIKTDRDGIRGEIFNREYVELSMSVNGSIPVNSDDNEARRGMPDLKPTLELGPSLDVHLWKASDASMKLDLILPVRVPVTLETSPRSIGWVFAPRLNLDVQNFAGMAGWNLGVGGGLVLADEKYHDYYYSIAPRFVLPTRPAYDADGGYSGAYAMLSLSKRFPKYWVGAYLRFDSLHGAAFDDSPLVRQDYALSGGIGIAWMIAKSQRDVEADE
jgi:MipA family protein